MTTRRKFGMGIAAMLAAQRAPAALVRSLVAGRQTGIVVVRLPYDAVDYLESTGTQYIDTGVKCADGAGFSIDGEMLEETTDETYPVMAGAQYSDWSDWLTIYEGNGIVTIGNTIVLKNRRINERIVASLNYLNDGKLKIESPSPTVSESIQGPNIDANICIFCAGTENGVDCFSKSRVYGMQVSVLGEVVRNLAPVRFTNELGVSEGAMYDSVSGQLFRNAGTGAFVIGPVKARGASGQNGGGGISG